MPYVAFLSLVFLLSFKPPADALTLLRLNGIFTFYNQNRKSDLSGYVYAVMFSNGTTKVGMSANVGNRLYSITHAAKVMGVEVNSILMSTFMKNPIHAEAGMIRHMKKIGVEISTEYFSNVSFEGVSNMFDELRIPYMVCLSVKRTELKGKRVVSLVMASVDECAKSSRSDVNEAKVLKLIEKNPDISLGVIKNRLKNIQWSDVDNAVDVLIADELVSVSESIHPKKGEVIKKYRATLS